MDIIGALKKSGMKSTVYFCTYNQEDFQWNDIVKLLYQCRVAVDLDESDVRCIAVESDDKLHDHKILVGVGFMKDGDYISVVRQDSGHSSAVLETGYDDISFYLSEMGEDFKTTA